MLLSATLLLLTALCRSRKIHKCVHDDVHHHIDLNRINVEYSNHPFDSTPSSEQRRLVDTPERTPIRINPYYDPKTISTNNGLSSEDIEYVKSLISTTSRFYQQFVQVVPIANNLFLRRECTKSYDTEFGTNCVEYAASTQCGLMDIPDEHMASELLYHYPSGTGATRLPAGSGTDLFGLSVRLLTRTPPPPPGIADTDVVLYVSYHSNGCGPSTLAWAAPCSQDQFGRPVAGTVNICPYLFETEHYWKQDVVVLLHETTHVLVMGPELWDDFRDVDGSPIAHSQVVSEAQSDGLFYITSPRVAAFAREHFGCDALIGFPLENTGSEARAGAHWDEHYAMSALMGSTIWGGLQYVTQLTLALMMDSGWYGVDLAAAEPFDWAKGAGCALFESACVESTVSNWPQFFCVAPWDNGCAHNYDAPAWCEFYFYNFDLPPWAQYFSDSERSGGPAAADFCM